jgi:teichuronic acid biosynthesis glycosyltransferase TuaH
LAHQADFVLVDLLLYQKPLKQIPAEKVVYRSTDLQASKRGITLEKKLLRNAGLSVWASDVSMNASAVDSMKNHRSLVLQNGVDESYFTSNSSARVNDFVYIGAIDERLDLGLISKIATQLPTRSIVLGGPSPSKSLTLPDNVTVLGPVSPSDVPQIYSRSRVGLLLLTDDPRNAARSPMKFYEYLASGMFILARRTREMEKRRETPGLHLYDTHSQALEIARFLMTWSNSNEAGRDTARGKTWQQNTFLLCEFIGGEKAAR